MAGKTGSSGGGFLEGITTLVEKLEQLAEKGEQLQKSGEFGGKSERLKGMYGMNVRIGGLAPGQPSKPSAPPPVKRPETVKARVQPIREPMVDVFEEGPDVLVVAELPGVESKDLKLDLREDILTVHAEHGQLKYHKEILLPRSFSRRHMSTTHRHGIFEIRFSADGEEQHP